MNRYFQKYKINVFCIFVLTTSFAFLFILPISVNDAVAAEISLAWDQNPESDIAGYKIYYGVTSRNYTNVIDVGQTTTCTIAGLEEGITYFLAATAYDTLGTESSFSAEISFIVNAAGYDNNHDGIPDSEQDNVVSVPSYDGKAAITLVANEAAAIDDATVDETPENAPDGIEFLYGFFSFNVSNIDYGGSVTVTIYLPDGVIPATYYKYGPTSDNPEDHWYEFLYDGETGAEINDNVITLHFVDGKRGDNDLNETNGIVFDPGGPGFTVGTSTAGGASSDGGGGGGSCFISAAAVSGLF